jgi:exodeoxyribonuclease VII large subunit
MTKSLPVSPTLAEREILTPMLLNRHVRDLLEDTFALIWIEGELSNFARPASGHLYFTLKDPSAQVRCAMFKPKSTYLRFRPVDGMRVLARARVSLYEGRGEYQLLVEHLEAAGEGALQREFEQLKARLDAEGLFAAEHKKPLPLLPRRIGVITSPSGAAIRDVLSVIARRFPLAQVEILPVPVQGREAPPAIVAMLRAASAAGRHDVLLLTRGGGSLEDLWAFNDEAVARAIHASVIPVIAAIGHEIDFTIADFVADLRAATPSAAAELLVPDGTVLARALGAQRDRLARDWRRRFDTFAQRLDHDFVRLQTLRPQARLQQGHERLQRLYQQLGAGNARNRDRNSLRLQAARKRLSLAHPAQRVAQNQQNVNSLTTRLSAAAVRRIELHARHLAQLARTLNAVSPLATLERGYAILIDSERGTVIRSVTQANSTSAITARLHDGELMLRKI